MKHQMITAACFAFLSLALFSCQQQSDATLSEKVKAQNVVPDPETNFKDGFATAGRLFPDKLRGIPLEIITAHYPNPCFAVYEDSMFVWKHNTTIQANEDLQLIEYGSFVYTKKGWYLRVTMSPQEFATYYNCPNALLKKGVIYTDKESWRRDKKLTAGDAMWYYLAKDKNGRIVKGTAPIETEGKLLNSTLHEAVVDTASINWTGYGEIGGYSLTGSVQLKQANITLDSNRLKNALVTIDLTTISHKEEQLQKHLRGKDFFDVIKYPTAIFEASSIVYSDAQTATITGTMNMKGINREIAFPVNIKQTSRGMVVRGNISIDRTRFGIKYNSSSFFGDLGDQAIQNKFDLVFDLLLH